MVGSFIIPQLCATVVTMWSWRDSKSTEKDQGGNLYLITKTEIPKLRSFAAAPVRHHRMSAG